MMLWPKRFLNWCRTSVSTETHRIVVNDLAVDVVRKPIKNLHLGVYPPHGRVRVAAPIAMSDDAVRIAVISKLGWIKRHRARFQAQPRQSKREMVSGESHYFLGHRYRLRVVEHLGPGKVTLRHKTVMELHVPPQLSASQREQVLSQWYREQLKTLIPPLLEKWQAVTGVSVTEWRIKKMKTKWGSCSLKAKRIWLNLELAKKPMHCQEYVLVHELLHFLERHHTGRFVSLMGKFMPQWRLYREELNRSPLGHDDWEY